MEIHGYRCLDPNLKSLDYSLKYLTEVESLKYELHLGNTQESDQWDLSHWET